jgi:type IV secretory pathway VirB3-like protein
MISQAPPAQTLTPEIQQQAVQYQLGPLYAIYKPSFTNPFAIIGIALGAIVADIIVFALIYAAGYILYYTVAVPIIAVILAISALSNSNLRIYHFEQGLIRAKGKQTEVVRWEHVRALFVKITNSRYGTQHLYTIERNDGASIKVTAVKGIEVLGQNIQQAILYALWPSAVASYQAGNTLNFGPLNVSMQGISKGNNLLPWNQVQEVNVKRGIVSVKSAGKTLRWSSTFVRKLPNFIIFMRLCDYARTGR